MLLDLIVGFRRMGNDDRATRIVSLSCRSVKITLASAPGTDDMKLTRDQIEQAFTMMGEIMARNGQTGEIAVYGGSAIMLQTAYRESTEDVDCVVIHGHGAVMQAMIAAGRKLKLPSGWLNEAVSTYCSRNERDTDLFPYGQYPSPRKPVFKVILAKPEYLLAMKIEALARQHPRDIKDVAMLAKGLGLDSVDGMMAVHDAYFDQAKVTMEMRRILKDVANGLPAPKNDGGSHAPKGR